MNKEKFVEKHAEKFEEMTNGESNGFKTKKYKVFIDKVILKVLFVQIMIFMGACIGNPCREGVVKITKKEGSNG